MTKRFCSGIVSVTIKNVTVCDFFCDFNSFLFFCLYSVRVGDKKQYFLFPSCMINLLLFLSSLSKSVFSFCQLFLEPQISVSELGLLQEAQREVEANTRPCFVHSSFNLSLFTFDQLNQPGYCKKRYLFIHFTIQLWWWRQERQCMEICNNGPGFFEHC